MCGSTLLKALSFLLSFPRSGSGSSQFKVLGGVDDILAATVDPSPFTHRYRVVPACTGIQKFALGEGSTDCIGCCSRRHRTAGLLPAPHCRANGPVMLFAATTSAQFVNASLCSSSTARISGSVVASAA